MIKSICCIGAGYVGGPTMAVIALKCPQIKITVVDANSKRIEAWNGPLENLPIFEPGLSEVIEKTRGKNLFFSNDIKGAIENSEMIFMAVNTPTKTEGEGAGMAADLKFIESCALDIAKFSKADKIVIEKSTVPIRTAEKIKEVLEKNSDGIHFEILSNPEFLAEGTAIDDMLNPSRVLIGGEKTTNGKNAVKELVKIYSSWVENEKILTTNVWSSELSKLASNAMLAQRVSSINSLSALCEKTGAEIDELSRAIGMDPRIGPKFLKASVGFGGSCFQKDILNLVYLCKYYGLEEVANYWYQVVQINNYQKTRIAIKALNELELDKSKKQLTILGWSFKANTNDSRESPSIDVFNYLYRNDCSINIYDPKVPIEIIKKDIGLELNDRIKIYNNIENSIKETSGILILTEWEEFKNYNWNSIANSRKKPFILDGRNCIDISKVDQRIKILTIDK